MPTSPDFRKMVKTFLVLVWVYAGWAMECGAFVQGIIPNRGQWAPQVLFRAEVSGAVIFFERDRLLIDLGEEGHRCHGPLQESSVQNRHSLVFQFVGSRFVQAGGGKKLPGLVSFFKGKDPEKWASSLPVYSEITYSLLWPGIDLRIYLEGGKVKYEFLVRKGFDPDQIKFRIEGAEGLEIVEGNLQIGTSLGEVTDRKPVAWSDPKGAATPVECRFGLHGTEFGFGFPGGWDRTTDLLIDPVLVFSTYSGSYASNFGCTASFDHKGFLYSGSTVFGIGYPLTIGAYQTTWLGDRTDIAITKYDTTGQFLVYSTLLGGSDDEIPHSLFVNDQEEVFMLGTTSSLDFPASPGAFMMDFQGGNPLPVNSFGVTLAHGTDMVISRLSASGGQLLASTYFGGSQNDGYNNGAALRYNYGDEIRGDLFVNAENEVFIASCTQSPDFPVTQGAFQVNFGGLQDGCVASLSGDLENLLWSSFVGGSMEDAGYSVAVSKTGDVFIAGGTASTNFPATPGAFRTLYQGGLADAFLTRIRPDGTEILASTFYGSASYDQAYFVQADRYGNPYILGQTKAPGTLLIENCLFSQPNSGQFIARFDPGLTDRVFGSVFGKGSGQPDISPTAFLVDQCDHIYVSGWGGVVNTYTGAGGNTGGLLVTSDAYQSSTDSSDFYLIVFEKNMDSVLYATFFGGSVSNEHVDGGTSRFSKNGTVYQSVCAGCGGHSDFPTTPDAWSTTNLSSNCNNAVFKFDFQLPLVTAAFSLPPVACIPVVLAPENLSSGAQSYEWLVDGLPYSVQNSPTIPLNDTGVYSITLIARNPNACNQADTLTRLLHVYENQVSWLDPAHACNGLPAQLGIPANAFPGAQFHWYPSDLVNDSLASSTSYENPADTTFLLVVTRFSCTDSLYQPVITHQIDFDLCNDTLVCRGQPAYLSVLSLSPGLSFFWSDSPEMADTIWSGPGPLPVWPVHTTDYFLSAATSFCQVPDTVTVTISQVDLSPLVDRYVCEGDSVLFDAVASGNGPFSWSWEPAARFFPSSTIPNPALIAQTDLDVTVTAINPDLCSDTVGMTVHVSDFSLDDTAVISPTLDSVYVLEPYQFTVNYPANLNYTWAPPGFLSEPSQANPIAIISGDMTFYVTVSDNFGCQKTDSLRLITKEVFCRDGLIFVPSAFSPDGDGYNDELKVYSRMVETLHLDIYDRWGLKVFQTGDKNTGWDGKYKGVDLAPGVYMFYLQARCWGGASYEKKGNVTLIR